MKRITPEQLLEKSMRETTPERREYKRVVYGTARSFKTEGDLYESITGHRSKVLDRE